MVGGGWASQRREQIYGPSLPKASEASGRRPDHTLGIAHGGVQTPPPPSQGPSLGVHLAGKGAIITWPVVRSPPD